LGKHVNSISPLEDGKGIHIKIKNNEEHNFSHVISTASLAVLRTMDLNKCNLSQNKRIAIRTLSYDHSVKVGLKFKCRWWQDKEFMKGKEFTGGKSGTDLPIRTAVYPSYGADCKDATGVIIVSYTWAQDAARLGAMIPTDEKRLVDLCLNNLVELHGHEILQFYSNEYYCWDWYADKHTLGAFALYGPGQFDAYFSEMIHPEVNGRLHFAGEATSIHHAWVVGSLNSAYRTVWEILDQEGLADLKDKLKQDWGTVEEVEMGKMDEDTVKEKLNQKKTALRNAIDKKRQHGRKTGLKFTMF